MPVQPRDYRKTYPEHKQKHSFHQQFFYSYLLLVGQTEYLTLYVRAAEVIVVMLLVVDAVIPIVADEVILVVADVVMLVVVGALFAVAIPIFALAA